ncbi:MAG: SAM-dependent methyltransferase, partial [Arcanobacterium sp.]|nr:SAM-dependent methyltransferase [Arcanobacterium sp.]
GDVHRFDKPPKLSAAFSKPKLTHVQWEQPLTVQELFELGTTRSSWIKSTPENRTRMRENLRWYLEEELGYTNNDIVMLPYHTYLWRAQLK